MRKIYVIDTNILIHAPEAILNFEDNEVLLPMVVLEELDGLKNSEKEKGRNAREAIRHLENLRVQGNLVEGVETEQGGIIRVEKNYVDIELPTDMPEDKMDNRILKVCLGPVSYTHLGAKAWRQAGFKDLHICGSKKPNGGKKHERYFNEATFRSRCSLWTSDKKMEP